MRERDPFDAATARSARLEPVNCNFPGCDQLRRNLLWEKMIAGRALHFVFKIPDRGLTAKFYREILGMKVKYFYYFLFFSPFVVWLNNC